MIKVRISEYQFKSRLLWATVLTMTAAILVFSLARIVAFGATEMAVLLISIIVAWLTSHARQTIPNTTVSFSSKHIFAFWGIIWLGPGGGTILAAAASVANIRKRGLSWRRAVPAVCADVVSAFLAALVFFVASGNAATLQGKTAAGSMFVSDNIALAACLMAAAHYLVHSSLSYLFRRLDDDRAVGEVLHEALMFPAVAYLIATVAALSLSAVFSHFGVEFGLVILPLAVIGNLAYQIHIRRLAQKTRQVSDTSRIHLATVEALATAIDAREQVGMGHVLRTQIYATKIGEILGLSENDIDALRTGSLLHGIGKLAVPDHILNKPGKLTSAELEKTRIHPAIGAAILERVGFDSPVLPTIRHHHECWNGTGYPDGLKGAQIPLTARILAVADAYDTLRSARPYRPPVPREEACSILRQGSGSRFDPKIVNVFLKNLRNFEAAVEARGFRYDLDNHVSAFAAGYVDQIKRANREVFTLYELAREFSSSFTLRETLALFTRKVRSSVPFDTCAVYLLNERTRTAECVHAKGKNSVAFTGRVAAVGDGVIGSVLETRKLYYGPDTQTGDDLGPDTYTSMAALPLIADDSVIGVVCLYTSDANGYGKEHLRLLETISRIAADAINKSIRHALTESHALTDPMTGLPNARGLKAQFDREVARASRRDSGFQLLVLDLDGFKAVNDSHGHKAGDQMLSEIGRVIRLQLRDYDFLGRYGGDEFVAIIPETRPEDVADLCRRIESAVTEFRLPLGDDIFAGVGISLGASSYPQHGSTFDDLLATADREMYRVKASRKRQDLSTQIGLESRLYSVSEADVIPDMILDSYAIEIDDENIISSALN